MTKLPGMGKEVVIDINSCGTDRILQAFEEIGNYIGSNVDGVGHQVQQVFSLGTHYNWASVEPEDP